MRTGYFGFVAGELSPLIEGRSDLDAMKMGCRLARNVIPGKLGALLQRPGFYFRGYTRDQATLQKVRLFPFVAGSDESYVIEAGDGYFRFWMGEQPVLTTADAIGKPGVISAEGDPLTLQTPWDYEQVPELQTAHANDVMWITHRKTPVQRLVRFAADGFYIEAMTFVFPPMRDPNIADITLAASATTGSITLTAVGGDMFLPSDVGSYYSLTHRRPSPFIELSLSDQSSPAGAALVLAGQPLAGETVSVGKPGNTKVYTWYAATPLPAYGVLIGVDSAATAANFSSAINGDANGTTVGYGTIVHPDVQADDAQSVASSTAASGVLSFTDNDLTAGSDPDRFTIGTTSYRFDNNVATGGPNQIQVGANLAASIQNAIHALNGTGVAGVNYTAGTVANTQVQANPVTPTGNSLRVVAIATGAAGNSIATTVQFTSRMSWGATTLQGGADGATERVSVTARVAGSAGNSIAVSENSTNVTWEPSPNFVGGQNTVAPIPVPTLRVNGGWEVVTLGRWYGTLTLQQQRATGEWETLRSRVSQNDNNVSATGTTNGEKLLRLIYTGSGENQDNAPARATLTATDPAVTGLVLITGVTSPTVATGTVIRDLYSTDPTYEWSGGAWSERYGYPSAVTLHQQRVVFGMGITVTGSQTSGFDNFERLGLADSSYSYDIGAYQDTPIVALMSQKGLIILTSAEEWLMDGGQQGEAITPTAFPRIERLSAYGAARSQALLIHSSVIFIQAGNQVLNEYLFDFGQDGYKAVDLTQLADHLTDEGIEQITWGPVPHQLLWAVTTSGKLLSMAYRRDNGMIAWTRHDFAPPMEGGETAIESVCCVPSLNREVSSVYAVVKRGGRRSIESIDTTYWERLRVGDVFNMGLLNVSDGAVHAQTADPVITGLEHLAGLSVGILVNGAIHPNQIVQPDGTVTISPPYVTADMEVTVGLPPPVRVQPMFLDIQFRDGASSGRKFRVSKVNPRFYQSAAATYQDVTDDAANGPYEVNFRVPADPVNEAVPLYTGLKDNLDLAGGWRKETEVIFTNNTMLPMNLTALVWEVEAAG